MPRCRWCCVFVVVALVGFGCDDSENVENSGSENVESVNSEQEHNADSETDANVDGTDGRAVSADGEDAGSNQSSESGESTSEADGSIDEGSPEDDDAESEFCDWSVEDERIVAPPRELEGDVEPGEETEIGETLDLSGQPPRQVLGEFDDCGFMGRRCAVYVVLGACESGGYEPIWGPDYAYNIEVGTRREDSGFADLVVEGMRVNEEFGCEHYGRTTYRWNGDSLEREESCTVLVWDEDRCGVPPVDEEDRCE